jgi:sulfite exporter TauE/SafE/copper chaperone CopZ
MNKYVFKIEGIHCAACEIIIERELRKLPQISQIEYKDEQVTISSNNLNADELRRLVDTTLNKFGYNVADDFVSKKNSVKEWLDAALITISVISVYIIIRELLKVDFSFSTTRIDYVSIFIVGVLASISTCMAVVGGIVLSISSSFAKTGSRLPIVVFHFSRISAFFLLGGILGLIGGVLLPTLFVQSLIEIILFFVFLILGLNLLGIKVFRFGLVKKLGVRSMSTVENSQKSINIFTTIILGAITFFLPCGFTQTAQFTAIASGSFINGALIMLVFALGTLPALAAISFASVKLTSPTFYKAAGMIVIAFAIINILQNLERIRVGLGI